MAQGYDLRDVVDNKDPSGQANVPVRQVSVPGVSTPRGGDVSQVGSYNILSDIAKLGGPILDQYIQKKQAEDEIKQQVWWAQGRTEAELDKMGVPRYSRNTYRALQLKDTMNRWGMEQNTKIETEDFAKDPETYRKEMFANAQGILDQIDTSNPKMAELSTSFIGDTLSALVSNHAVKHNDYNKTQTKVSFVNLVDSTAPIDPAAAAELVTNAGQYNPSLPEDERKSLQFETLRNTLRDGNMSVLDKLGGLPAVRAMGASEAEYSSVKSLVHEAQGLNEQVYVSRLSQEKAVISKLVKNGELSAEEGVAQLQDIQKQFNLQPEWVLGNAKEMFNMQESTDELKSNIAILTNPEYNETLRGLLVGVNVGEMTEAQGMSLAKDLASQTGLSLEQSQSLFTAIKGAANSNTAKTVAELEVEANKLAVKKEKEQVALNAASTHFRGAEVTDDMVKTGFALMRSKIANEVLLDDSIPPEEQGEAIRDKWVQYLVQVPTNRVDPQTKADIQSAFQSQPTEIGGTKVRPEVVDALNTLIEMKSQGLSQTAINNYIGTGNKEYIDTAMIMMEGGDDPAQALTMAFDLVERGKTAPTDAVKGTRLAAEKLINDVPEKIISSITPNVLTSWLGGDGAITTDDVLNADLRRAAEQSDDLKAFIRNQVKIGSMKNPYATPEALVNAATQKTTAFTFVSGALVPPNRKGQSLTEVMGLEARGNMAAQKAFVEMIRVHGKELMPPGSEQGDAYATWLDKIKSAAGEEAESFSKWWNYDENVETKYKTNLDKFAESAYWMLPSLSGGEAYSRRTNDQYKAVRAGLETTDITWAGDDTVYLTFYKDSTRQEAIGDPIALSAKEVGKFYNQRVNNKVNREATENAWFKK